jgi:ribosomal protein L37E
VSYAEERVDGVAAASVDDGAGWTEESAVQRGIADGGDLMGEEAIAPCLEELGVEVWTCGCLWGLFGDGESGEGEAGSERCGGGGGELQHLAAGVCGFGHRRNLRTIVWNPNFWMRVRTKKGQQQSAHAPQCAEGHSLGTTCGEW